MKDFTALLQGNAPLSLVFLYGLLTSIHCIGMCGAFVISASVGTTPNGGKARRAVQYNLGRVISYTLTGALAGGFGRFFSFTGIFKGIIPLAGGAVLVVMGLEFSGLFKKLKIRLPSLSVGLIGKLPRSMFLVGLASAIFPCGPLQAMQFYSLGTGSFFGGAIAMLVFVLATIPVLFTLGIAGAAIPPRFTSLVTKVSGVLLLIMGLLMFGRGLALSGVRLDPSSFFAAKERTVTAMPRGDAQLVVWDFTTKLYPKIVVRRGVPLKWIILTDKKFVGECTATIEVPEFGIRAQLHEGENVFEFVPDTEGTFPYHSWCGMIFAEIQVVEIDTGGEKP